jgi:RHS repeat-associated protein
MGMPGRKFNGGYRYGFNGKENDNEVKGEGNQQDYGFRIYDPRLVKFLSIDPLTRQYPWYTPYQFAGNKTINSTDLDGLEENNSSTYLHRSFPILKNPGQKYTPPVVPIRQVTVSAYNPTEYEKRRSAELQKQRQHRQNLENATMDPLASGIIYPMANAVNQYAQGTINHGVGVYEGIRDGQYWDATKNAGLFALDVAPFFIKGGSSAGALDVTMGMVKNEGASLATAAKTGAPYYSEWAKLGIYNPANFKGWGDAFKYITDKVIASGGKINFELKGLDIPTALAGDANIWVGRYTAWELQQITKSATLFKNTEFYLNGVKQTTEQLIKLGIKAPVK